MSAKNRTAAKGGMSVKDGAAAGRSVAAENSMVAERGVATGSSMAAQDGLAAGKPIGPGTSQNREVGLLGQIGLFMQWQFRRQSVAIPVIIVLQLFVAVTVVYGYSYVIGDVGRQESLYLLTAGPTLSILTLGFSLTTQIVGTYRTEGSFDWMLTLPLGRLAFVLSDLLVWGLVVLPGLVIGAALGSFRFDVDLSITWWAVPGAMLVSLIAASVGYAAAVLLKPQIAMLVGQLCIFVSMIFAPMTFPVERLPHWLQTAHQWLPFEPMAQVMRGGLASEDFSVPGRSWVLLAVWGMLGLFAVTVALRRRT